jgi:hypothetical protein
MSDHRLWRCGASTGDAGLIQHRGPGAAGVSSPTEGARMPRPYLVPPFRRFEFDSGEPGADFQRDDRRLERLIRRLPRHRQASVRWLRGPAARWVRVPLGILFIVGSLLFILPVFGLWMLPVGLLLLAEDVPALRRPRGWVLDRIEYYRPHWFSE